MAILWPHLSIDIWQQSRTVSEREGESGGHFDHRHRHVQENFRTEKEHKGRKLQKSMLYHPERYRGRVFSTHISFHKFLPRERELLGNWPWNLPAYLIITITCSTLKASRKIKTSTYSAKHHLDPAFMSYFSCVCIYCVQMHRKEATGECNASSWTPRTRCTYAERRGIMDALSFAKSTNIWALLIICSHGFLENLQCTIGHESSGVKAGRISWRVDLCSVCARRAVIETTKCNRNVGRG